MVTRMRVLALTLWVVTMGCFAAGWLFTNRVAIAAGCATLVLFIVVAGRAQNQNSAGTQDGGNAEPGTPER